jgi:hypothetical protein
MALNPNFVSMLRVTTHAEMFCRQEAQTLLSRKKSNKERQKQRRHGERHRKALTWGLDKAEKLKTKINTQMNDTTQQIMIKAIFLKYL